MENLGRRHSVPNSAVLQTTNRILSLILNQSRLYEPTVRPLGALDIGNWLIVHGN